MKTTIRIAIAGLVTVAGTAGGVLVTGLPGRLFMVAAALAAGVVWGEIAADREASRIEETLVLRLAVQRRTVARAIRERDAAYERAKLAEDRADVLSAELVRRSSPSTNGGHHG